MELRQDNDTPLLIRPVPPTAERIDKKKFLGVFAVLGLVLVLVFALKLQNASTAAQTVPPAPLPSLSDVSGTGTFDGVLQVPKTYAGLDRRPPAPKLPIPGEGAGSPFGAGAPPAPPTPPLTGAPPTPPTSPSPPPASPPVAAAALLPKPPPSRWLFADLSAAVAVPPFPVTRAGSDAPGSSPPAASADGTLLRPARQATPADPSRVLYRSHVISGILMGDLNSDIPGQVRIMVTQPVTDRVHQSRVLIPQASILIGVQEAKPAFGQNRLAVKIEEVHTPEGTIIALPGQMADRSGASGVKGKVNNHYGAIGVAAVVSAALNVGARSLAGDPAGFQLNIAQELAREAGQSVNRTAQSIVERTLNIPPRITLKAGTPVTIQLADNLVLPPPPPAQP